MEEFREREKAGKSRPEQMPMYVGKRGLAPFHACEGETTKPADDRGVEGEVIPPAGVVYFIDADVVVEDTEYQRKWCNPAVPDSPEEAGWFFRCVFTITGYAAGQEYCDTDQDQQQQHCFLHPISPYDN